MLQIDILQKMIRSPHISQIERDYYVKSQVL